MNITTKCHLNAILYWSFGATHASLNSMRLLFYLAHFQRARALYSDSLALTLSRTSKLRTKKKKHCSLKRTQTLGHSRSIQSRPRQNSSRFLSLGIIAVARVLQRSCLCDTQRTNALKAVQEVIGLSQATNISTQDNLNRKCRNFLTLVLRSVPNAIKK